MHRQTAHFGSELVSVIIPAYNAEAFIEETLRSVLAQTYKNIEVLVVDDGSVDRTAAVVDAVACNDNRVILLRQLNAGVAAARNAALERAKGAFIAPIDADDIWRPRNLEKQVHCMHAGGSSVGVVYSWTLEIDEEGAPTGGFRASRIEGNVFSTLICHYFLGCGSASLIRRECFDRVGVYNEDMRALGAQGCEDWELYARIASRYEFRVVPELLVGYRKVKRSMSSNYESMAKSHAIMWSFLRKRNPDIPPFVRRLSSSSFYIYLAGLSHDNGDLIEARRWLLRAVEKEPLSSILRIEAYLLLLSCLLRKRRRPGADENRSKPMRALLERLMRHSKSVLEALLHHTLSVLAPIPPRRRASDGVGCSFGPQKSL